MAKRSKSDDFIDDDEDELKDEDEEAEADDGSDEEDVKPKKSAPKKAKTDDADVKKPAPAKKAKKDAGGHAKVEKNADGESYIELGKDKRVTVREFKGNTLIDVREFYTEKGTGTMKPGKKGISLSPEQWRKLVESVDLVEGLI